VHEWQYDSLGLLLVTNNSGDVDKVTRWQGQIWTCPFLYTSDRDKVKFWESPFFALVTGTRSMELCLGAWMTVWEPLPLSLSQTFLALGDKDKVNGVWYSSAWVAVWQPGPPPCHQKFWSLVTVKRWQGKIWRCPFLYTSDRDKVQFWASPFFAPVTGTRSMELCLGAWVTVW
jgi:hypothetical protein